ncbi:hypothetical protein C0993_002411, partial [Termitomyces sp. T159_Od127]
PSSGLSSLSSSRGSAHAGLRMSHSTQRPTRPSFGPFFWIGATVSQRCSHGCRPVFMVTLTTIHLLFCISMSKTLTSCQPSNQVPTLLSTLKTHSVEIRGRVS